MFSARARQAIHRVTDLVEDARLRLLSEEERRALLALLRGVSLADGVLAAREHDAMVALAAKLHIALDASDDVTLGEAVSRLARSARTLRFACLVVADALFVDGSFDAAEKDFVAGFAERFGLDENPLADAVETLRRQKLEDAIAEWSESIGEPP